MLKCKLKIMQKNRERKINHSTNFVNGNYRNITWQTTSPVRVKRADVRAFVATGYFARRSKYLKIYKIQAGNAEQEHYFLTD